MGAWHRTGGGKQLSETQFVDGSEMSDMNDVTRPGDEAPADSAAAGEDICSRCNGSGELEGRTCPACGGEGVVMAGIGGA
jgi:hypothetical protein